ncbi:NAD(P)/FAD-dependent oxidoreductase [Nocardia fluminea]|uniref:NAD(P)/FAD-dependent oxidoreductase n=1 Tax=Nocardia fluminea TaxID=134984 RepID=UPI0033FF1E43
MDMSFEVVIIGAGPAGLQAALVLARARRRVLVLDAGQPRNAAAAHLHGFLSRDGMEPGELLRIGREEVMAYGGQIRSGTVEAVDRLDSGSFAVTLARGERVDADTVLVATGLRDELPAVPGIESRWGRDVLHCPYCHGYEVAEQPFAVLGGENRPFSIHQAGLVRRWSSDVIFFPDTIVLSDEERERLSAFGVRIIDGRVNHIAVTEDRVAGVVLADGTSIPRSVVFVGPRFLPRDDMLKRLGCERADNGWVRTDATGATTVPGVWAAGNVVDSPAQIISAAGSAYMAAVAINHYLLAADIDRAVAGVRRGETAFSAEMERRVCELVLGDRRHGM